MPGLNEALYHFYKLHGDKDGIETMEKMFRRQKQSGKQIKKSKRKLVGFLVESLGYEKAKKAIKNQVIRLLL